MKVIDIYNMIANGEKVPKYKLKSTHEDNYYWVDEYGVLVYSQSGLPDIFELTNIRYDLLNDEIEIIEDTPKEKIHVLSRWYPPTEDKKIENIEERIDTGLVGTEILDEFKVAGAINKQASYLFDIAKKINEIINRLNGEDNE